MKTINIDGKEYVLKEDVDAELKAGKQTEFHAINSSDSILMDEAMVLGVGCFQLDSQMVVTKISTEYLEKVVKCLKTMSLHKEGLETIVLAWGRAQPAIIGTLNKKGEIGGFIIAPRVESG